MSKLLIAEPPLEVLPGLATAIGLNEAIVLQQVHYWILRSEHHHDGKTWVYNSYDQWQRDNFPFWSTRTIKRTITSLETQGLLYSTDSYNPHGFDRTKWYTIDYDHPSLEPVNIPKPEPKKAKAKPRDFNAKPESPVAERSLTFEFEEFWKSYPTGRGSKKASKAWWVNNVKDPETADRIMRGLEQWLASEQWQDIRYVKHAERWLRDLLWENPPPPASMTKARKDSMSGEDLRAYARELREQGM